jgi:CBS domain containing-hemolysin-like protein
VLDDSSTTYLLIIGALVVLQALLTLLYAALQNTRQSTLQELADNDDKGARDALNLLDAKTQLYVTYNMASLLINFTMAILATMALLVPDALSTPVALLIVLAIGFVAMIFGNVLPEAVGSAYADPLRGLAVPVLRVLVLILRPFTALMLFIGRTLARLFGSDQLVNTVTEEEIMTLVNAGHTGGTIEEEEKAMIYSVLYLDQTLARELMVPRLDMIAMDVSTTLEHAIQIFINTGFSRVPVYDDTIDNIVGLIYAKDILNLVADDDIDGKVVRNLVRSAYFVPESKPADELLREMQARKVHMAIVVDEYGGTSGIVTIENLIEEIIGDIRDEYDQNEQYEYIRNSDDEYIIDASMDLDDVNELLNTSFDTSETDTLGGFIYQTIGRVPIVGETIETDELTLRVRSLEGRRIRKVLVKLKPRPQGDDNLTVDEERLADAS